MSGTVEAVHGPLARLTQLVPPSTDTVLDAKAWESIYNELGSRLPLDYVELIDRYGGGRFDGYLWLLEPDCSNPSYDLVRADRERSEALLTLWDEGEPKPSQMSDPSTRLIPWASTDNGEFIYWLAGPGVLPDDWTVIINEARGDEWESFPVGCVEFLVDVLDRTIESRLLSSLFPVDDHKFRSF